MSQIISEMPTSRSRKEGLRLPQIRVLRVLCRKGAHPMTKAEISEVCGNKTSVVVGRAIGYSDPAERRKFEQTKDGGGSPGSPCPSLLTLGYVREVEEELEVGVTRTAYEVTANGRKALQSLGHIQLPPLRD